MRKRLSSGLRLIGLGVVAAVALVLLVRGPEAAPGNQAPLLEKVQALGKLHAVKFTYRDISDFHTSREPVAWLDAIPGGRDVVAAATRNRTTLSYTGEVEAGIDLSQAKLATSATGPVLVLPQPEVYRPNVVAEVHGLKSGLFWKDDGIVAKSIEMAKDKLSETARRQGILRRAKENAQQQVQKLAEDLGANVRVTFAEG